MNNNENTFLILLKNLLHPQNDNMVIEDANWASILDMADKQNLFPLVYSAASSYSSFTEFDITHPQYFTEATAAVTDQMQRTNAFLTLYNCFIANGLKPITVKGIVCRNLYGDMSDYRPSGDEDILIDKANYEKAAYILESCGYKKETYLFRTPPERCNRGCH